MSDNETAQLETSRLRAAAREMFDAALREVDPAQALANFVRLDGARLYVGKSEYDLRQLNSIYSVAIGKAALPLAAALTTVLGGRLDGGVLSAPRAHVPFTDNGHANKLLPASWQVFAGGHPLPDAESLAAAQAAKRLLREQSNKLDALVIFLVSGGGSAMMELPRRSDVTLDDLRSANRLLVNCGATIREVNALRRRWSLIKGGGLSRLAPKAQQATLIVSDTNAGDEAAVASGPTIAPEGEDDLDVNGIIARYDLARVLPASIVRALDESAPNEVTDDEATSGMTYNANRQACVHKEASAVHPVYVLLENKDAIEAAAYAARLRGFSVVVADDLIEQRIEDGCAELVRRLNELLRRARAGETVCLISGGEFRCAVRGQGRGGRNSEAALRCAMAMNELWATDVDKFAAVALQAGTDGIDGNSPAAGAIADSQTTRRAAEKYGLDAHDYLERSDAYTFFHQLGDDITIGATKTNVRDLRIMLARKT